MLVSIAKIFGNFVLCLWKVNIQNYAVIKSLNEEENKADTKGQFFYTLLSLQIEKIVYFLSPRTDPISQHITTISNYRLEESLHLEISEK